MVKRVLSIRPWKIGTPSSMHLRMTSRRCIPASRPSSVGVRWIAIDCSSSSLAALAWNVAVSPDGATGFPQFATSRVEIRCGGDGVRPLGGRGGRMQKTCAGGYHPSLDGCSWTQVGDAFATEARMSAAGAVVATGATASDTDLVAGVRAGDDSAFEELYRRYQRRIASFIRRVVRDEARAEDVTQEAFMSALRRLRATDSEIAFKPWIYEIARNAAIDQWRRSSRAEEVSISQDELLRPGDRSRLVGAIAPET